MRKSSLTYILYTFAFFALKSAFCFPPLKQDITYRDISEGNRKSLHNLFSNFSFSTPSHLTPAPPPQQLSAKMSYFLPSVPQEWRLGSRTQTCLALAHINKLSSRCKHIKTDHRLPLLSSPISSISLAEPQG